MLPEFRPGPYVKLVMLGFCAGCATSRASSLAPRYATDSAMYVATLGPDTSYVQSLVRQGNDVRMDIVERIPRVRFLRTRLTLNDDGSVSALERLAYLPASADTSPVERATVRMVGDSTIFETKTSSAQSRYASAGRVHLVIGPYNSVGLPLLARYVPERVGDSIVSLHAGGSFGDRTLIVKRISADTFTVASRNLGTVRVHVGAHGESNGFNALGSSFNTVGVRVAWLPVDSLLRAFSAVERARGATGLASPRDTTHATIDGANLTVDYGRPSKRGRELFGVIVPWNLVWRTGANEATHFTTDRYLRFGDSAVPPGRYTLWIIPAANAWTFIINNQTDQWGTDYDPAFDRLRVPMQLSTLSPPVEKLTIALDSTSAGGVLRVKWDTVEASVPFTVQR